MSASEERVFDFTKYQDFLAVVILAGSVVEIFVIVFLFFEICKTKSFFHSGYFKFYLITLIFNAIDSMMYFTDYVGDRKLGPVFLGVYMVENWYTQFANGFWYVMIGFTQCTALAFPVLHQKFFAGVNLKLLIAVYLLFPFLVDGYSFSQPQCRIDPSLPDCVDFTTEHNLIASVLNFVLPLVAIVFVLYGVCKSSKNDKTLPKRARMERRLIVQTVFSSFFLCIFAVLSFLSTTVATNGKAMGAIGNTCYVLQHYPSLVVLFIVSPAFRHGFLHFYRLRCPPSHPTNSSTTPMTVRVGRQRVVVSSSTLNLVH